MYRVDQWKWTQLNMSIKSLIICSIAILIYGYVVMATIDCQISVHLFCLLVMLQHNFDTHLNPRQFCNKNHAVAVSVGNFIMSQYLHKSYGRTELELTIKGPWQWLCRYTRISAKICFALYSADVQTCYQDMVLKQMATIWCDFYISGSALWKQCYPALTPV